MEFRTLLVFALAFGLIGCDRESEKDDNSINEGIRILSVSTGASLVTTYDWVGEDCDFGWVVIDTPNCRVEANIPGGVVNIEVWREQDGRNDYEYGPYSPGNRNSFTLPLWHNVVGSDSVVFLDIWLVAEAGDGSTWTSPVFRTTAHNIRLHQDELPARPSFEEIDQFAEILYVRWCDNSFNENGFVISGYRLPQYSLEVIDSVAANHEVVEVDVAHQHGDFVFTIRSFNSFGESAEDSLHATIDSMNARGRCCYDNNTQCAEVTYVECNGVAGVWTRGVLCSAGCGSSEPVGRCCYNHNLQCVDVTQAECQTVSGAWTQGATCNDGCGGGDPTGRCCYNSNQSCQDVTQTQCNGLAGTWTGGVTCAAGCGGGGQQCATSCETAAAYTPGNIVSNCTVQNHSTNWFSTTLGVGTWRFQIVAASGDFDIYTYADDCVTQLGCYGEAQGDEDFTCNVQGSAVTIRVMIYAYDGQGGYQFAISQVGIQDDPHAMKLR